MDIKTYIGIGIAILVVIYIIIALNKTRIKRRRNLNKWYNRLINRSEHLLLVVLSFIFNVISCILEFITNICQPRISKKRSYVKVTLILVKNHGKTQNFSPHAPMRRI